MTLHVELLMPDRSLWSGEAGMVIAKTIDGDPRKRLFEETT